MRLAITPLAEQDLESIADYIAQDNPARAVTFVRELQGQCQRLVANPSGYRLRTELGDGIRSCAYGRYVIFFVTTPDEVIVIRILHGARDLPAVFHPDEP
ncbi:type II toxin-antitoxin system RelE/ParE family toxin [Ralstonia solanacearum]|uniref:Type II toxin-antitoxin system RelE/ParE family toxin n=2 Tax=Ralstonia solanacearum TaxID=305 RepID=A0A5H2PV27_RALSL|nr:type II toxin-antitoxin system RelE/ParE family toxin [Ralstonia solanacearum]AEG67538.1 conserved hypothethical protein [Ralstonia solanacearum Po82]AMP74157.1 plasmid stabilization protein [Ralstonia solanacearum]AYB59303.1 type II toxin-antitoxin system RelE/ParE family toxin [Ralstonia solanacearum]MCG3575306.1 type II toxin-antitoxin system RelE/ParE family toxin [Ralstonia solanacearum]MDB0567387.1 type II toxin-antitoxin system RelE/ParE family toxin [Ralstonia solanacearum]